MNYNLITIPIPVLWILTINSINKQAPHEQFHVYWIHRNYKVSSFIQNKTQNILVVKVLVANGTDRFEPIIAVQYLIGSYKHVVACTTHHGGELPLSHEAPLSHLSIYRSIHLPTHSNISPGFHVPLGPWVSAGTGRTVLPSESTRTPGVTLKVLRVTVSSCRSNLYFNGHCTPQWRWASVLLAYWIIDPFLVWVALFAALKPVVR